MFDTARLLSQITLKGSLPDGRFEDSELLDFAYDALLSEVVPVILAAREDYFVTYKDYTVTANQAAYVIPNRALNGIIREAKLVSDTNVVNLERLDLEEITSTTTGAPWAFYIQGNNLMLYPTPSTTTGTLRLWYFIRPSRLVDHTEVAAITAINTGTNTITITTPTGWTTSNTFDLMQGRAHFDILDKDLTASSVSATTIVFSAALPTTLQVGDYVALAEETSFPMVPPEAHVALIQCAVAAALESMGDPQSKATAEKSKSLLETLKAVLSTRVQGQTKRLGRRLL